MLCWPLLFFIYLVLHFQKYFCYIFCIIQFCILMPKQKYLYCSCYFLYQLKQFLFTPLNVLCTESYIKINVKTFALFQLIYICLALYFYFYCITLVLDMILLINILILVFTFIYNKIIIDVHLLICTSHS